MCLCGGVKMAPVTLIKRDKVSMYRVWWQELHCSAWFFFFFFQDKEMVVNHICFGIYNSGTICFISTQVALKTKLEHKGLSILQADRRAFYQHSPAGLHWSEAHVAAESSVAMEMEKK